MNTAVYIRTFGCQMNVADSETLAGMLEEAGFEVVEARGGADVIILNTCSVRLHAEERAISLIGDLAKDAASGGFVYGVIGCMAQARAEEIKRRFPSIGFICGTKAFAGVPDMIRKALKKRQSIDVSMDAGEVLPLKPGRRKYPHKAFVPIMRGCSNFCSYCIVPYVRGAEQSLSAEKLVEHIRTLGASGVKEVTLLGQNVNSYMDSGGVTFPKLLEQIASVEAIEWIRFLTSHPKDLSDKLIDAIAWFPKVCRSLHLPMQSGSDEMLAKMNRRYSIRSYMNIIEKLRRAMPDIRITTDVIVGFPGETETDFAATQKVMEDARFGGAFIFKYSPRPGTQAASLEDDVPKAVKEERNQLLLSLQKDISTQLNRALIGSSVMCLIDETAIRKGRRRIIGTTCHGHTVVCEPHAGIESARPGRFATARVDDADSGTLFGTIVP